MNKKPDLLVLVVIWELLSVFVALVGIAAVAIFAFPDAWRFERYIDIGAIFGLSIVVFVLLTYIVIALASAIGVLQGREWGRILSIVHAVLSMFAVPVGTVIGILAIVYLLSPQVRDYFVPVETK